MLLDVNKGQIQLPHTSPDLEVIKLEYSLRLEIRAIIANHCGYFESENELKFYYLEVRSYMTTSIQTTIFNKKSSKAAGI